MLIVSYLTNNIICDVINLASV